MQVFKTFASQFRRAPRATLKSPCAVRMQPSQKPCAQNIPVFPSSDFGCADNRSHRPSGCWNALKNAFRPWSGSMVTPCGGLSGLSSGLSSSSGSGCNSDSGAAGVLVAVSRGVLSTSDAKWRAYAPTRDVWRRARGERAERNNANMFSVRRGDRYMSSGEPVECKVKPKLRMGVGLGLCGRSPQLARLSKLQQLTCSCSQHKMRPPSYEQCQGVSSRQMHQKLQSLRLSISLEDILDHTPVIRGRQT